MTESESRDHTLKEWENELNKDLLFLENILGQDDSQKNAPEHIDTLILELEKFFREADMGRGPEIIEKITQIKTDEYATKIFLNIIQQLVKAICIAESLKELGLGAIKVLPNFFDEQSTGTKKKELFKVFYKKYSSLMPKFKQAVTATDNFQIIVDKLNDMLSGKLDEINIKIEENQRALHQLAMLQSSQLQPELSRSNDIAVSEYKAEDDASGLFYICTIGGSKMAISEKQVLNIYKISPKKAIKMAKKSFIRFPQLGGFFSSITSGLKKELKNKSKEELNNIFLLVLNPLLDIDSEHDFTKAIVVRLPDKDRFGVIFVKSVLKGAPVECDVADGLAATAEGNYNILDIYEIWQRNELMEI